MPKTNYCKDCFHFEHITVHVAQGEELCERHRILREEEKAVNAQLELGFKQRNVSKGKEMIIQGFSQHIEGLRTIMAGLNQM